MERKRVVSSNEQRYPLNETRVKIERSWSVLESELNNYSNNKFTTIQEMVNKPFTPNHEPMLEYVVKFCYNEDLVSLNVLLCGVELDLERKKELFTYFLYAWDRNKYNMIYNFVAFMCVTIDMEDVIKRMSAMSPNTILVDFLLQFVVERDELLKCEEIRNSWIGEHLL